MNKVTVYTIRANRDTLLGHFDSPREALKAISGDKDEAGFIMGYSVHDGEVAGEMGVKEAVDYLRGKGGVTYGQAARN
jgi:hypothetical protein